MGPVIAFVCAQALAAAAPSADAPRSGVQVTALATATIVHGETLRGGDAAGALKRTLRRGLGGTVNTEFE